MTHEFKDALVPLRDKNGKVTGIMDQATAEYMASSAPDPTQKSIDLLLSRVTRVRVVPFANYVHGATEVRTLLDTSAADSLASFRQCFAINEDRETFGHCMCCGDPHMELFAGADLVATIGYHHGFSIRWEGWKHDAHLKEPNRLLDWMSAHGVDGPCREVQAMRIRSDESQRNVENWLAAMPGCCRPYWEQMRSDDLNPELHRQLLDAIRLAIPSPELQVLELFGWFGSGTGPWSGYPAYESVPEYLLLHYPTKFLIGVLNNSTPTESQWCGAARYFESWEFGRKRKGERKLLTAELKKRFLEAAQRTGIVDNVERAEDHFRD